MNALRRLLVVALLTAAVLPAPHGAMAQTALDVDESTLKEPWELHLAAMAAAAPALSAAPAEARASHGDRLAALVTALAEYEKQCDWVIDHIVGDPYFAYIATETSETLAGKTAAVHSALDAVYSGLQAQQREDVVAAQVSLDRLVKLFRARKPFERDVMTVIGTGGRDRLIAFATVWWHGEEKAIALKKRVEEMKRGTGISE